MEFSSSSFFNNSYRRQVTCPICWSQVRNEVEARVCSTSKTIPAAKLHDDFECSSSKVASVWFAEETLNQISRKVWILLK